MQKTPSVNFQTGEPIEHSKLEIKFCNSKSVELFDLNLNELNTTQTSEPESVELLSKLMHPRFAPLEKRPKISEDKVTFKLSDQIRSAKRRMSKDSQSSDSERLLSLHDVLVTRLSRGSGTEKVETYNMTPDARLDLDE